MFDVHGTSGMALPMLLILIALIVALVVQSQFMARSTLQWEERQLLQTQLRIAATDAAWGALRRLAEDGNPAFDHPAEAWAGPAVESPPTGIAVETLLLDENRFFNVNNLGVQVTNAALRQLVVETATRLLRASNQPDPDNAVNALRDWMNVGSEGERKMESPADLTLVLSGGPDRQPSSALDVFTVLPITGVTLSPINLNTAGKPVLLALFGEGQQSFVERLCARREARPLISMAEISGLGPKPWKRWSPLVTLKSRYFSVIAQAEKNGQACRLYGMVQRLDNGDIQVLRWLVR